MSTPDTASTDIIERAANAAFGPYTASDEDLADWGIAPGPDAEKTVRVQALAAMSAEVSADLAPRMARGEALTAACLVLDLALAVHKGFKFLPGVVRRTPGLQGMSEATIRGLLDRHVRGDWGDCRSEDAQANEVALLGGGRLLSSYKGVRDGDLFWTKVWVITDADMEQRDGAVNRLRPSTLVLLPSEY
jgi:hypothetical protein